ncbi:hypothetical protein [Aeromonas salmonicida]|uniref:hypothetical protein n=1 Tax=Aeromonas salmonicida TaxID=645 RepID=UPI000DB9A280|nr:hypothetical protein [Aeromonas salmonicida]
MKKAALAAFFYMGICSCFEFSVPERRLLVAVWQGPGAGPPAGGSRPVARGDPGALGGSRWLGPGARPPAGGSWPGARGGPGALAVAGGWAPELTRQLG